MEQMFRVGPRLLPIFESRRIKRVLPEHEKPDKSGWKRLTEIPLVVLDGDDRFRRFLADCERDHGVSLKIGAECTSYPQAVDLAEVTGGVRAGVLVEAAQEMGGADAGVARLGKTPAHLATRVEPESRRAAARVGGVGKGA